MIKPILVPVEYISLAKLQGNLIMRDNKLYTCDQLNQLQLHGKVEGNRAYNIVLIDTEAEIVDGDWYCYEDYISGISKLIGGISNIPISGCGSNFTNSRKPKKIISSTNKSHNLPQLSEESIELLISYYNQHKRMYDIVEVNTWWELEPGDRPSDRKYDVKHVELNKQGEVDITIPNLRSIKDCVASHEGDTQYKEEKLYTETEVLELCKIAHEYGGSNCMGSNKHTFKHFKRWFNSKKK